VSYRSLADLHMSLAATCSLAVPHGSHTALVRNAVLSGTRTEHQCCHCAGYNPKTKPSAQGGGSTGRAGCGKPTNYRNSFSGSGTVSYGKPWCGFGVMSRLRTQYSTWQQQFTKSQVSS
jgi:hypothetical protein